MDNASILLMVFILALLVALGIIFMITKLKKVAVTNVVMKFQIVKILQVHAPKMDLFSLVLNVNQDMQDQVPLINASYVKLPIVKLVMMNTVKPHKNAIPVLPISHYPQMNLNVLIVIQ